MARSFYQIPYTDRAKAEALTRQILISHRFKEKMKNGELVWSKGGFWTAAQCVAVRFNAQGMDLQAWVKNFGLAECSLDGVVGVIPKQQFQAVITQLGAQVSAV